LAKESILKYFNNSTDEPRQRGAEGPVVVDQVDPVLGFSAADLWCSLLFCFSNSQLQKLTIS